jgi:hypothetical protein
MTMRPRSDRSPSIEAEARKVTWTETLFGEVMVGYRNCDICGLETPEPSDSDVVEFVKTHVNNFMWPIGGDEGWMPNGWEYKGDGLLCPDCVKAKNDALAARRKTK